MGYAHSLSEHSSVSPSSLLTAELQEDSSGSHKSLHLLPLLFSASGICAISYGSIRRTLSTLVWETSQPTPTPSNQRRPSSSPCSVRPLSCSLPSHTSSASP